MSFEEAFLLLAKIFHGIANVISSIILVKYYAAFLRPKWGKRMLPLIGFGAVYLLSLYLTENLFITNSSWELAKILIIAAVIYTASFAFFEKDFGIQIFLLCSFLVMYNIAIAVAGSVDVLLLNGGYSLQSKISILKAVEQRILYLRILNIISLISNTLTYAAINFLALRSITKNFIYKYYRLRLSELLFLILPCLSGLSILQALNAIRNSMDSGWMAAYFEAPMIHMVMIIANSLFLMTVLATVKLFQKTVQLHMDEKNAAVFQNQIQQLQEQIRNVDGIYTEIRGMRHDMKNHLSNIQLLVKSVINGNQDVSNDLTQYLDKMGNTLDKFEFAYQTGNSISDVIIHQKYLDAMNSKIDFSSDFIYPTRLNLDAYDLAVILNNALENAVEACGSAIISDRFIRLYSYMKGEMFFIEIENSFMGNIALDSHSGLPVSNKPDKKAHGIGLSNIRRCAEKYFGDIIFQVSKKENYSIFHLKIMLQGRS